METHARETKLMKMDRRTGIKIPDVPGSQELYGWNSGYLYLYLICIHSSFLLLSFLCDSFLEQSFVNDG